VGKNPTAKVAPPINVIVIRKTGRRPIRSPREPKNAAPRGLTTIPAPKVARLAKRPVMGSELGKKSGAKATARVAKVRKSYHSRKVPKQAAVAILG
jgi:hypothetical protein